MEMVEQTLKKKQETMLAIEDYLNLVDGHKNLVDLTVRQLHQKTLMELVSRIQLMNFSRSTLQDDAVSPYCCLPMEEVIKGLGDIDWHECHIISLRTQNAPSSASSAAPNNAVSVKKPKKAPVATTTGPAFSSGTNGAVSMKPKKVRVAARSTTTGA